MEMEVPGKDSEHKHRNRLKGLFTKVKSATTEEEVDDFLHGPSDKLTFATPSPVATSQQPPLPRIDTSSARRWPAAADVRITRGRSTSPKRSRKGLIVRFADNQPEIIGEGGDEATTPTSDIGRRRRANSHPPPSREHASTDGREIDPPRYGQSFIQPDNPPAFRPGPLQCTQTGYESLQGIEEVTKFQKPLPRVGVEDDSINKGFLKTDSHDPTSFAARVKAEMDAGEGRALLEASPNSPSNIDQNHFRSTSPPPDDIEISPQLDELHINTMKNVHIPPSPGIPTQPNSGQPLTPKTGKESTQTPMTNSPLPLSTTSTMNLHGAAIAVGDDALKDFSRRTLHLLTLFRLSAESFKSFSKCSLEEVVRAALWWFLKGRLYLEATIRDRPDIPHAQQTSFFARQQAYADLAKSLWLIETVAPQYEGQQQRPNDPNVPMTDILESRQGIISNLKKLCMSMKRNNFLPPEGDDAPLAQGLDCTIWIQDDGNRALVQSQRSSSIIPLVDAFPLGDSSRTFHYARIFAEAILIEDTDSQKYRCQVLISIVRAQTDTSLVAVVASQNGTIQLSIQADKSRGPVWEDVSWWAKINTLDVKLPRGFLLRIQCVETDFRTLWGIYDHQKQVYASLAKRQNEEVAFETVITTCQFFDQTGTLPKEPLRQCRVRVFEKLVVERPATGARTMHRGFRLALVTSPKTKSLQGFNQEMPSSLPIQFGFLRGEDGRPALLLKIDNEKSKFTVVLTFDDVSERTQLHTRLTGVALQAGEEVVGEGKIKIFSVANQSTNTKASQSLKFLDWQSFRMINEPTGDIQHSKTVLSEHLRAVLDFKSGSFTDRVNVEPGELKLRLDVNSSTELKILRQSQQDMTVSVSESQVSKELVRELVELLGTISNSPSTRTYTFPSLQELHLFQTALTGFNVLFDGIASSFNISRRRMVVPIYKKWDAATTRVQVIQKEKVVQLVAFFENFSHGECMNFALKSTDTFETSTRGGKFSLRIVDAKFALPKERSGGEVETDAGFVCLDMPEYPGEHDDITIYFENEAGKLTLFLISQGSCRLTLEELGKFIQALPASTKTASRMASVRR